MDPRISTHIQNGAIAPCLTVKNLTSELNSTLTSTHPPSSFHSRQPGITPPSQHTPLLNPRTHQHAIPPLPAPHSGHLPPPAPPRDGAPNPLPRHQGPRPHTSPNRLL